MKLSNLDEGLSRVWQYAAQRAFAIISASRHEETTETNRKRNAELASLIRSAGFGYFLLTGHYDKTDLAGNIIPVTELAFFISLPQDEANDQRLHDFVLSAIRKLFGQESAIIKYSKDQIVNLIAKDGKTQSIGKFHPNLIARLCSELHGRHRKGSGRTFAFESAKPPKSWSQALVDYYKVIW